MRQKKKETLKDTGAAMGPTYIFPIKFLRGSPSRVILPGEVERTRAERRRDERAAGVPIHPPPPPPFLLPAPRHVSTTLFGEEFLHVSGEEHELQRRVRYHFNLKKKKRVRYHLLLIKAPS